MVPTFFLIDDDEDDQQVFSFALSSIDQKIKFFSASDGNEALDIIRTNRQFIPDYIFLDLNMPRMGGIECLYELKKLEHIRHVPIIIYTTSSDQRDKERIFEMGASDFKTKPSDISELKKMIREIIK